MLLIYHVMMNLSNTYNSDLTKCYVDKADVWNISIDSCVRNMVVVCTLLGLVASLQGLSYEPRAGSECIKGKKLWWKPVSWKPQIFDFLVSHQLSVSYIADTGRRPCNSAGLPACEIRNRAGWRCWSKRSCQIWDRISLACTWPHSYQLHWQCSICVGKFQKQGVYSLCTIFSNHCVYLQVTLTVSST